MSHFAHRDITRTHEAGMSETVARACATAAEESQAAYSSSSQRYRCRDGNGTARSLQQDFMAARDVLVLDDEYEP